MIGALMLCVMYKKMHDMYGQYIQSRHICTEKKIFFCLLQVMSNYRTNDITNSTFLYTEHIKPFSRKHTIHKIQNEGMSHDAQTIKSTAKIKKNKSHHMKSSFAAQVPL